MKKLLEYHEITKRDLGIIAVFLLTGCVICFLFKKDGGDILLWCLAGIIPVIFSWLSARTHKLKIAAELLAAQYFTNFLEPVCQHIKDHAGITLSDGSAYPECKITVVIPNKIGSDINRQLADLKQRLSGSAPEKIKSEVIECAGRPRNMMIDISTPGGILDFPTTLSGINTAISEIYPDVFSEGSEKYDRLRDRALQFFTAKIHGMMKRAPYYEDYIRIVTEKDLLAEYAEHV